MSADITDRTTKGSFDGHDTKSTRLNDRMAEDTAKRMHFCFDEGRFCHMQPTLIRFPN